MTKAVKCGSYYTNRTICMTCTYESLVGGADVSLERCFLCDHGTNYVNKLDNSITGQAKVGGRFLAG